MSGTAELARALRRAKAPVIFGLAGISLENQHAAFRLARALRAAVSVEAVPLPTLTRASLARHTLVLTAGGEPDFDLPCGAEMLRDDRLLSADAWRALSALARGHAYPGAEAFRALYERIGAAGGAAALLFAGAVPSGLSGALSGCRESCALPRGLDYMLISGRVNLLSAYTTALEEAGGAHACFAGPRPLVSEAYALDSLLCTGGTDAALCIGDAARGADAVLHSGVPLYGLGAGALPGAAISLGAAPFPACDGGTIVRCDGLASAAAPGAQSSLPPLSRLLSELLLEVRA